MKAVFESVATESNSSFRLLTFESPTDCEAQWHFHPEYEIVVVDRGRGARHVGAHLSHYENGELIFIGSNIPHLAFNAGNADPHREVVVQMREGFLGRDFMQLPEMTAIAQLFDRSKRGIVFEGAAKKELSAALLALPALNRFDQLIRLVEILQRMALTPDYRLLHADRLEAESGVADRERIQRLYAWVEQHFDEPLPLEAAAKLLHLTPPAFCRYFKKTARTTFTHFVNRYRILRALQMIDEGGLQISEVGYRCGFNNLSYFNRQFQTVVGQTPTQYKQSVAAIRAQSAAAF